MNALSRIARNRSGSTLMTVMMVMLILSIIAIGAIQAASNNVIQAKKVDNYERLYYGAESVLEVAADLLRKEVTEYYNSNLRTAAISDYTTYGNLEHNYLAAKNSFPSAIANNCTAAFVTPDLTGYQYGGISTTTVFSNGVKVSEVDGVSTYIFTISCQAEENGTTRRYDKYVEITLEDIDVTQDISRPPQINVALAVGGTLRVPTYAIGTKIYVYSTPAKKSYGNALVGATSLSSGSQLICANNPIDPTVVEDLDWRINIGQMLSNMRDQMAQVIGTAPVMDLCAQPTSGSWTYDNATSVELTNSTYSNMRIRGRSGRNLSVYPSRNRDVTLNDTTLIVSTANLTLSGSSSGSRVLTIKNGTIWAQGSLTLDTRARISCSNSSAPYAFGAELIRRSMIRSIWRPSTRGEPQRQRHADRRSERSDERHRVLLLRQNRKRHPEQQQQRRTQCDHLLRRGHDAERHLL
jgi:Tfp pilus assembly protein PilX